VNSQEIYSQWNADRACDAYDSACAFGNQRQGLLTVEDVFRSVTDLHALVLAACRAAVGANDRAWLEDRFNAGMVPPISDSRDEERDQEAFTAYRRVMVLAHLGAARVALEQPPGGGPPLTREDPRIVELLGALGAVIPFGLVRDLVLTLAPGADGPQPALATGKSRGLLVEVGHQTRDRKGRLATVWCELVSEGTGAVYAHPEQAFTVRDQEFLDAERNASAFVRPFLPLGEPYDLRWRLIVDSDSQSPPRLYGPSCGAALALAAGRAAAALHRR
jgi:hypothetical protein